MKSIIEKNVSRFKQEAIPLLEDVRKYMPINIKTSLAYLQSMDRLLPGTRSMLIGTVLQEESNALDIAENLRAMLEAMDDTGDNNISIWKSVDYLKTAKSILDDLGRLQIKVYHDEIKVYQKLRDERVVIPDFDQYTYCRPNPSAKKADRVIGDTLEYALHEAEFT